MSSKRCIAILSAVAGIFCIGSSQSVAKITKGKILVVLSSGNELELKDGKKHPTGFYLNELGVPLKALVDAGYEPIFCNPKGNESLMDKGSEKEIFFGKDPKRMSEIHALVDTQLLSKRPQSLEKIANGDLNAYSGIFVPGGHAPMIDLWNNAALGKILKYFHEHHKPTAMICHGPIALLSAANNADAVVSSVEAKEVSKNVQWPYKGYKMTVFSDAEEKPNEVSEKLGGPMKFYPEDALKAAGGEVEITKPGESHVVVDRELITGQNPFSDEKLAADFIAALNAGGKVSN